MVTATATATDGIRLRSLVPDNMRTIVVAFVSLLLAIAAGLSAFAQSGIALNPFAAARAFPPDGHALAKEAEIRLALARTRAQDPTLAPDAQTIATARAGYAREPLEPEAVAILAQAEATDRTRLLRTLEAGHALSRRSVMLNSELIALLLQAGRLERALPLLDEILRQDTAAQGPMLTQMATYAGQPSLQPVFLDLLSQDAPWVSSFWRQVAQSQSGLQNAAPLRIAYGRRGGRVDPEVDRLLVAGLADQGRFDDAAKVAETVFPALRGISRPGRGELVRNGNFRARTRVMPFDWRLLSNGDFGASPNGDDGGMIVSGLPGSRGVAAEQLIALPNRPLTLAATVDTQAEEQENLLVELQCGATSQRLASVAVSKLPAKVPTSGCRWGWLRLLVRIPADGQGADWTVRKVSLR